MTGGAEHVQLWLLGPQGPPAAALPGLTALLGPEEQQRAAAFRDEAVRDEYIACHAALRLIAGRSLAADPAGLVFTVNRNGKPELPDLPVNLSHSGGLALIGVAARRRIGVDVQHHGPESSARALTRRHFGPAEQAFVYGDTDPGAAPADQPVEGTVVDRFTLLWARKEAMVKAAGERLAPRLGVPVLGSGGALVDYPAVDPANQGLYRIFDVTAPDGFRAAVALSGPEPFSVALHRWTWPEPGSNFPL